jgi:hypothetical protein
MTAKETMKAAAETAAMTGEAMAATTEEVMDAAGRLQLLMLPGRLLDRPSSRAPQRVRRHHARLD